MEARPNPTPPHVLILPLPAQGHVNSMLKLAELFALAGIAVTFLNSEHNHDRLVRYTDLQDRFAEYPGFRFKAIPDGLPAEHPRSGQGFLEACESFRLMSKLLLKDMLVGIKPAVDCIIADGIMGYVIDIANEVNIPTILFRTVSACSFWIYFSVPRLIQAGELPINGNEDMDRLITEVAGMETFLRCRDLPSFCRVNDMTDPNLLLVVNETCQSPRAHALILNTFEDLEEPILSHIRNHCPKTYTIGPLHQLLKTKLRTKTTQESYQSSNSLWEVDRNCMKWLDNQPLQSVLYVSFGSIAVVTREQFMEFWYGLVNSKKMFLWVMRPDSVAGVDRDKIPLELQEGTRERGLLVEWVPQEEVLEHKAIGGFLTHSGWNSTLESIGAGVPMICWSYFADQQVNSRFVSDVWKLGLDMKDVCDREVVEKMVNDLMVERKEEFVKSATGMAELSKRSVSEGGSSYCNLNRLIEDIRLMNRR